MKLNFEKWSDIVVVNFSLMNLVSIFLVKILSIKVAEQPVILVDWRINGRNSFFKRSSICSIFPPRIQIWSAVLLTGTISAGYSYLRIESTMSKKSASAFSWSPESHFSYPQLWHWLGQGAAVAREVSWSWSFFRVSHEQTAYLQSPSSFICSVSDFKSSIKSFFCAKLSSLSVKFPIIRPKTTFASRKNNNKHSSKIIIIWLFTLKARTIMQFVKILHRKSPGFKKFLGCMIMFWPEYGDDP